MNVAYIQLFFSIFAVVISISELWKQFLSEKYMM